MLKLLKGILLTVVVSFYLFPISFTFIPTSINSKMLVAVFGIAAFVYNGIRNRGLMVSEQTLISGIIATVFSVWCLICVYAADSHDMTYASYIVSYLTWMAGAYGVYSALRLGYDEVDLPLLTRYLAYVCVAQCISAVLIDNFTFMEELVDKFMDVGQGFYKHGHRLYGVGAALDPAGIRFSTVLVLIAHQIATNRNLQAHRWYLVSAMIDYSIIMILGAVISRTTLVGASMGLAYILFSLIRFRRGGFMTLRTIQMIYRFILALTGIVIVTVIIYRHSAPFQAYFRFGFEAFFNWVETGKFHTTSSDHLMQTMWIWPDDFRTWMIGRGTFADYINKTDIGYCNFVFYCGVIGLLIFSVYFLYCHLSLNRKFRNFLICSLLLVALTFIVWAKVATDIFFIDALLFCIAADEMEEGEVLIGDSEVMIP